MNSMIATSVGGAPNHIYYNARLDNYEAPGQAQSELIAEFRDSRPASLINRAKDYELSIVRFQTSLQSLPCLIVEHPTQSGPTPTNTAYQFTIASATTTATQTVQWIPSIPGKVQGSGDYLDSYWYEYDFIRFGSLVNACLSQCMAVIAAAEPMYAGVPAPYFSYDVLTAAWSLTVPTQFQDNVGTLQLLANTQAAHLFSGFPVTRGALQTRYNVIIQPSEVGSSSIKRTQIPGSLTTWNPVRRFVFTTQTLPVVAESINSVTNYLNGDVPSGLASQQIISDLTPELYRGDELRSGVLSYTPAAQYRYISLTGEAEIRDIDFRVWWEDSLGNLHPHTLLHNDYVSVKFLFHRKI